MRILIAEDDRTAGELLLKFLELSGFEAEEKGIELIRSLVKEGRPP